MAKVILINGPARSGKDTLGHHLVKGSHYPDHIATTHCFQTVKFADVMHTLWRKVFDAACIDDDEFHDYVDGDLKNMVHPELGVSYRHAMIDFSENYIKPTYGVDFFGKVAALQLARYDEGNQEAVGIVTDSGFKEEAVAMIERFGAENVLLIQLRRAGFSFRGDSRGYIDLTEFGVKTVYLENVTIEQLVRDGRALVSDFLDEKSTKSLHDAPDHATN